MGKFPEISGIVLGGGKSRRMGEDKRCLKWEGVNFLDRVCQILSMSFEEVLVVTAERDYDCTHLPVRLVTDTIPDKGSIGGLYTGLVEATHPFVFVVACDMPFLKSDAISQVCSQPESDVVMVRLSKGLQPLHARYGKRCVPKIENMIHREDLRIQNLTLEEQLSVNILEESCFDHIDPNRKSFLNINTPADLEFARKMAFGDHF